VLFRRRRKQFETLVLVELPSLYRLALRLTGNQAMAEDLVQETLLRAYRSFGQFKLQEYGIKPWLFKILHHIFFNERTAAKRHHVLKNEPPWELVADQHPDHWPEIDINHLNWDQFDDEIKRGVEALAPEYRVVLLLWALEQLNYKEIGEICNVPAGTVMSRLFRARKDLSVKLAGYAQSHRLFREPHTAHGINHHPKTPVVFPEGSPNGL